MNPALIAPAIADGMKTSRGALVTTTPRTRAPKRTDLCRYQMPVQYPIRNAH